MSSTNSTVQAKDKSSTLKQEASTKENKRPVNSISNDPRLKATSTTRLPIPNANSLGSTQPLPPKKEVAKATTIASVKDKLASVRAEKDSTANVPVTQPPKVEKETSEPPSEKNLMLIATELHLLNTYLAQWSFATAQAEETLRKQENEAQVRSLLISQL